jgi:hypothetical protein
VEQLPLKALAYDTMYFYTHMPARTCGRKYLNGGTTSKAGTIYATVVSGFGFP